MDDGSGDIILRVYEAAGGRATAELTVCDELSGSTVREVTVTEDGTLDVDLARAFGDDKPRSSDGAVLTLQPFQMATLRISL